LKNFDEGNGRFNKFEQHTGDKNFIKETKNIICRKTIEQNLAENNELSKVIYFTDLANF